MQHPKYTAAMTETYATYAQGRASTPDAPRVSAHACDGADAPGVLPALHGPVGAAAGRGAGGSISTRGKSHRIIANALSHPALRILFAWVGSRRRCVESCASAYDVVLRVYRVMRKGRVVCMFVDVIHMWMTYTDVYMHIIDNVCVRARACSCSCVTCESADAQRGVVTGAEWRLGHLRSVPAAGRGAGPLSLRLAAEEELREPWLCPGRQPACEGSKIAEIRGSCSRGRASVRDRSLSITLYETNYLY